MSVICVLKIRTRQAKNIDFKDLYARLIYTTEIGGWVETPETTHLLTYCYFYNELWVFGIDFVFPSVKSTFPQKIIHSLLSTILQVVSASFKLILPARFSDNIFHNSINLTHCLIKTSLDKNMQDKINTRIQERITQEIGVNDMERTSVCPGLKRLVKYAQFSYID